jgi:hypothetical protein
VGLINGLTTKQKMGLLRHWPSAFWGSLRKLLAYLPEQAVSHYNNIKSSGRLSPLTININYHACTNFKRERYRFPFDPRPAFSLRFLFSKERRNKEPSKSCIHQFKDGLHRSRVHALSGLKV